MCLAIVGLGKIEKDNVRMQLWCGITVYGPCAIVLELRCYPLARRLRRKIPADASLNISL